jgi:hypothetical protein
MESPKNSISRSTTSGWEKDGLPFSMSLVMPVTRTAPSPMVLPGLM